MGLQVDADLTWRATVSSEVVGYVCQSNCKVGYDWYPSIQRCLKVGTEPVNLGKALVTCGKDGANLAPIKDCDEMEKLRVSLNAGLFEENQVYRVGTVGYMNDAAAERFMPGQDFLVDS